MKSFVVACEHAIHFEWQAKETPNTPLALGKLPTYPSP